MLIESSFIPFPSEIILIPAGMLVFNGSLNIYLAILISSLASLLGALINYFIGFKLGKSYLLKKKNLFFINPKHLHNSELFFNKYGSLATFIGRLIPIIRQYISIPAGFSRMNLFNFCISTLIGSAIWSAFLLYLGYFLGNSATNVLGYYNNLILWLIGLFLIAIVVIKILSRFRK